MKRWLIVTTALVLVFTFCAACTQPNTTQTGITTTTTTTSKTSITSTTTANVPVNFNLTGFPIVNESISLNAVAPKDAWASPWNDVWFWSAYEKMTGINIEVNNIDSASWNDKKNLLFATNEIPDLFIGGITPSDESKYGPLGTFMPLNELIDQYASFVKQRFSELPDLRKSITTPDGNIYSLPTVNRTSFSINEMYYINIDWLNNLNLKEPTTLDELYNVLVAFRDNDPDKNNINDTIPMSGQHGVSGNDSSLLIINAMGYVNSRIDVIDDKVVFVPNEDNYKHALEYMNKLFVEKLLDQEYFTQSPESYIANIDSLKYGLYYLKRQPTGKNVDGKYITQYKTFAPLTSEYNSVKTIGLSSGITSGAFVITSKCKYPEAMIRWADFLFSEEGTVMGRFGPVFDSWEGQTGIRWKTTDDGKKYWEPVMPKDFTAPYYEYRGKFLIPLGIPWFIDEKIHNYQMAGDPLQSTTKKNVLDNTMQYSRQGFPKTYFSDVEQEDVNSLQTDIFTYVNQMEANFIIGRESLEKWDDYINTLKAMGVDELIMIYQTAYQRWIDAN